MRTSIMMAIAALGCGSGDADTTAATDTGAASADTATTDTTATDTASDDSAASDATPGDAPTPSENGLFATLNGEAKSFTASFGVVADGTNLKYEGGNPSNTKEFMSLNVKDAVGTYDCKTTTSTIIFIGDDGNYTTSSPMGACSIKVTSVATASGQTWSGTFTATLVKSGGGATIDVTNGSFSYKKP